MTKIKLLPTSVINLIAAGEVAESPAMIIKELLENAFDAGATAIEIELQNAGLDLIRVHDNGHGIAKTELTLAPLRHATSKITTINDLEALQTLGFRGEALASIAQVAQLELASRTKTSRVGYVVHAHGDQISDPVPQGMQLGTTITITELFTALPVRKKFLKTVPQELQAVLKTIAAAALIHPDVAFRVTHNQEVIMVLETAPLASRVMEIWPQITSDMVIPIELQVGETRVHGLVGNPQAARRTQPYQLLSINSRPVSSKELQQTIKAAYGTLMEPRSQPAFCLHFHLPAHTVDANVHPHKTTVKIAETQTWLQTFQTALAETLATTHWEYRYPTWDPVTENTDDQSYQYHINARHIMADKNSEAAATAFKPWQPGVRKIESEILQIRQTYLVTETDQGLIMIDQHAAHERILYQQILSWFESQTVPSHQKSLSQPMLLRLSKTESLEVMAAMPTLETLGFELEKFGDQNYKVTAVPSFVHLPSVAKLLPELSTVVMEQGGAELSQVAHPTIAYLSCKSAIKAGEFLTITQRQELLDKLWGTDNYQTCPHGRPTVINVTNSDLERLFRRKK